MTVLKDTDNGYAAMRKNLFAPNTRVLVGITQEVGAEPHGIPGRRSSTILEIAIWNHFGTEHVPQRPWLSDWFDKNKGKAETWLIALMPSVISGKRTKEQVLNILGLRIVGDIQKVMTQGTPPPNAESTIRKKGSSITLIDNGVLRGKITHVVRTGKP